MTRLNILLWLAVVASAMLVVHTQYQSRRLYVELEQANNTAHKLDTETDRLDVLRRAESRPLQVEKLAKDKLQMRQATPGITVYVNDPTPAAPAAAPAAAASASPSSTPTGKP